MGDIVKTYKPKKENEIKLMEYLNSTKKNKGKTKKQLSSNT